MELYQPLLAIGEPVAAALYEEPGRSLFYRKALALRRYYEALPAPAYHGEALYPCGVWKQVGTVTPCYLNGLQFDLDALRVKDATLAQKLAESEFFTYVPTVPWDHTIAGDMYTHSMPNYERIIGEGLESYIPRIQKIADTDMREGLLHLLAGIRSFRDRCVEALRQAGGSPELIQVLERIPFLPCRTLTEAIMGWNFALYLDNCDNLGDLANGLMPYFHGENAVELLRCLYDNLDANNGYSMQLDMAADPRQLPLVLQCLQAAQGRRRPMIELFVDKETPSALWEAAFACIRSGSSTPSFYNRRLYREGFAARFGMPDEDIARLCGGGCTEMMVSGLSNVGSLDAGLNLLLLLRRCMDRELAASATFEDFYEKLVEDIRLAIEDVTREISRSQRSRAQWNPLPMRTLLVDDCIDTGVEYNAGGARYKWSIISYAGIVNVLDSLLVIRDKVYREGMDAKALLDALNREDPAFLRQLRHHPRRHGIDDPDANALAYAFTHRIFGFLKGKEPYLGGAFLPASILFSSYPAAGEHVAATPDGRMAGEAAGDSLTAIFAKDTEGPTALMRSITSIDLKEALGTPVVNFTIRPDLPDSLLQSLIQSYMTLGGMQLQITCISRETLEKACQNPEAYQNLVVRVGGYSEYFCRLPDVLKRKIIERTFYG